MFYIFFENLWGGNNIFLFLDNKRKKMKQNSFTNNKKKNKRLIYKKERKNFHRRRNQNNMFNIPDSSSSSDEDDLFNRAITPFDFFSADPFFGDITSFDNMTSGLMKVNSMSNAPGTVFTKSYVSKINYKNGKPEKETYQSQSIRQIGRDGHKIQEEQEQYENTKTGIQKASHSRMLDNKSQKMIKKRNRYTGENEEHNILDGIKEDELGDFNKTYNEYREKVRFQDNYKMFGNNNQRRIEAQKGKRNEVKLLGAE